MKSIRGNKGNKGSGKKRAKSLANKYWEDKSKYLEGIKGKRDITPDDWKAIVYETNAIAANNNTSMICGGTISSRNFVVIMKHLDLLNSGISQPAVFRGEAPTLEHQIELMELVLEQAKDGLERHNSQPLRFITYDPKTGNPVPEEK